MRSDLVRAVALVKQLNAHPHGATLRERYAYLPPVQSELANLDQLNVRLFGAVPRPADAAPHIAIDWKVCVHWFVGAGVLLVFTCFVSHQQLPLDEQRLLKLINSECEKYNKFVADALVEAEDIDVSFECTVFKKPLINQIITQSMRQKNNRINECWSVSRFVRNSYE
jgi:hypothetical protein